MNSKNYACKIVSKDVFKHDTNGDFKKNFFNEVRVLRTSNHKNIISMHEIHEDINNVYLITDYVTGPSITSLLQLGVVVPDSQLIPILKDALSALQYLHSNGVLMRDINPRKLIMKKNGVPSPHNKTMIVGMSECSYFECDSNPTVSGTYGFIPPEVAMGSPGDKNVNSPARDIFSLGASIYYVATKNFPFKINIGDTLYEANTRGKIHLEEKNWSLHGKECIPYFNL